MKLLGNYKDWITPELWHILTSTDGDCIPVWQPERWTGNDLLDSARILAEKGYAHRNHNFQQYNSESKEFQNFDLKMPIPIERQHYHWWFVKYLPGQMQPMHFDPHVTEIKNCLRYTMMLEDYHPGHVFVYDDQLLTNYKAGDLFLWPDAMIYHGAVNISYKTRYSFQLTAYDQ